MKRVAVKERVRPKPPVAAFAPTAPIPWRLWLAALGALSLAVAAYSPALRGEFVFDDLHLPFAQPGAAVIPLAQWLSVRPLLMFTYWLNLHAYGLNPFSYHVVNLGLHCVAAALFYVVARKILQLAGRSAAVRTPLAVLLAGVFLLHPMQTEAVSYVAQRGESLGAAFFFAAWSVFLYRKQAAITWPLAAAVLALYGAAAATKEHTITLPAVLLLTDLFFPQGGIRGLAAIRRNWKLYLPVLLGGLAGSFLIARYISRDTASIGFGLTDFTWYQYFFTQWRAYLFYLLQFVLPLWQTVDHDFAVSRTPFDHGAAVALLSVLSLAAAAIVFRKRFPLASFGFLLFLLLLLPTSSVIPIKDLVADRRLYLPMVGLLFVIAEALRRFRYPAVLAGALMLVLAGGTFARNQVWESSLRLWQDAAAKAPGKQRVHFGLAVAEFRANQCHEAVSEYRRAAELEKPDYTILMNLSLAYECDHQTEQAIATMLESIRIQPSAPAWASMGLLYARQGKVQEAMESLMKGQVIDPTYPVTYLYRARIHQALNDVPATIQNLEAVLRLDPTNETALQMMAQVKGQAR